MVDRHTTVCYDVSMAPPTTPVHIRVENTALEKLEQLGKLAHPKPLNRSEMINVAIRDYVLRNDSGNGGKSAKSARGK